MSVLFSITLAWVHNPKSRIVFTQAKRAEKAIKAVANREEYEVEDIVREGTDRKKNEKIYLVKWKGYSDSKNLWVSEKDLTNAPDILAEWKKKKKNG